MPNTPLYDRLKRERRLLHDPNGDSNIAFLDPRETVLERWRQIIAHLYDPANLYERF